MNQNVNDEKQINLMKKNIMYEQKLNKYEMILIKNCKS